MIGFIFDDDGFSVFGYRMNDETGPLRIVFIGMAFQRKPGKKIPACSLDGSGLAGCRASVGKNQYQSHPQKHENNPDQ
jgi:hypothetical protein